MLSLTFSPDGHRPRNLLQFRPFIYTRQTLQKERTMPRPTEPDIRHTTDKEVHTPEGRDPYPSPSKGVERASIAEDDTADPGELDSSAPHDRGRVENGEW